MTQREVAQPNLQPTCNKLATDTISRQAAIEAIESHLRTAEEPYILHDTDKIMNHTFEVAASCVYNLPSIQPERLTDDDFETIRIHLNAYKENLCNQHRWEEAEEYQRIIDRFMAFASAQPERKKGKWGEHGECPFCGYLRKWEDDNYCANCGAKMEREE